MASCSTPLTKGLDPGERSFLATIVKASLDQCDGEFTFDDLLTLLAEETGEPRFDIHGDEAADAKFGEVDWLT